MQTYLGYIAGILSVLAYVPYIRAILADRNKPESPTKCRPKRASWIIWVVTSWIIIATMNANSSAFSKYQAWAYAIGASVTFLVSIRYGIGGWRLSDRVYLGMALSGLILWGILHSAWYAFALAAIVDGIGVLPVIKARGEGENPAAWILFFIGSFANLLGVFWIEDLSLRIDNPRLADIVYPIMMTTIIFFPLVTVIRAYVRQSRKTSLTPSLP